MTHAREPLVTAVGVRPASFAFLVRKGKPGILSVGTRADYPREFWSGEDWKREEEAQRVLGVETGRIPTPAPSQRRVPELPRGFSLHPPRSSRDVRGKAIDALLAKLGIHGR